MSDPTHRNALPPDYRVHWYRIERILGQGGFGITYLAHDANLDQPVAIKEYLPVELAVRETDDSVHPVSDARGEDYLWGLERFVAEARTLARFDHPSIVRVHSVFEHNNTAYMVMRYEQGRSLQEMLAGGRTLEEDRLRAILFPVLEGLRLVHAAGFIHRDIKPANLFIRDDGSPVLLDFGSARQALGAATRTLTTLVSPGYAPFEQYYTKSDRQGPWTDIYGLGATLYRACTGVVPMDAVDRSEGLLKGRPDPFLSAVDAAAGRRYSRAFLEAVDQALAFREDERPRSVDEWAQAFGPGIAEAVPPVAPPAAAPPVASEADTAESGADTDATTLVADAAGSAPGASAATPSPATPSPAALYRRAVGTDNAGWYVPRFIRFDGRPPLGRIAWNWPAALWTIPWLAYRRMPWWSFLAYPLVTLGLTFAVLLPVSLLAFDGGPIPPRVGPPVLILIAVLLPGLYASAFYHAHVRRMLAAAPPGADAVAWLGPRAGTSSRAGGIALAAVAVLALLAGMRAHHARAPKAVTTPPVAAATPAPATTPPAETASTSGSAASGTAASATAAGTASAAPAAVAASAPAATAEPTASAAQAAAPATPPAATTAPAGTADTATDPRTQRIDRLLAAARDDVARGQVTAPPGDNAVEKWREVLALDPSNETARAGVRDAAEHYANLARDAATRRDFGTARTMLDQALAIAPDNARLRQLHQRLVSRRRR